MLHIGAKLVTEANGGTRVEGYLKEREMSMTGCCGFCFLSAAIEWAQIIKTVHKMGGDVFLGESDGDLLVLRFCFCFLGTFMHSDSEL